MPHTNLPAQLTGIVTRFAGNGRKLGYPTANILSKTALRDGVYFGYATLEKYKHHPSLIFIGTPTTMGDTVRRVETHILDIPDKDYYDKTIEVELLHYHRSNKTFPSVAALAKIMHNDEMAARQWFKKL